MPMAAGLHWDRHGDPAAPPLILSAGLGGSGHYWLPNVPALAEHHCVYLYDHRGTALSDRALPATVTVDDLACDMLALMDAIGIERASVLGHAAGAVAALALALRAPDRVAGLILVNGWSRPDPHFARCVRMRLAVLEQGGPEAYLRAQPVFLFPPDWISANDAKLEAGLAAHVAEFQGDANLKARAEALMAFDVDDRLGEIAAPALLVVATDDMLVPPANSRRLAQGLPNATLATMTGGHGCNVIHIDHFNRIALDWLSGLTV